MCGYQVRVTIRYPCTITGRGKPAEQDFRLEHGECTISNGELLAIDVGNSRIKYGWFDRERRAESGRHWPRCRYFTATPLSCPAPWDRIREWTDPLVCDVAIAGSNPAVVEQIATHWEATTDRLPWVVRDRSLLPISVIAQSPERVGLDRLLNAIAANELKPPGEGAIVVDSGTATTIDVITPLGEFAGGAILPGFSLSSKALHDYTALLPELSLAELGPEPPRALGVETRQALRSGIYWGQVGAIRQIIHELTHESDREQDPSAAGANNPSETAAWPPHLTSWMVLTGGGAIWLERQFPGVLHVPSLAMHGLVLASWARSAH